MPIIIFVDGVRTVVSGMKGKKHSEETKIKIGEKSKGNTYAHALKGRKHTAEHIQKLTEAANRRVAEGRHNNYKGGQPTCLDCGVKLVSYTAKRCKKCRSKYDMSGENHWAWKGGVTPENKKIRSSFEYQTWRNIILKRDNYTCVECGDRNYVGRGKTVVFQVDHIKSFAKHPELRLDINNGRTLCIDCHKKTASWGRQKNNTLEAVRQISML